MDNTPTYAGDMSLRQPQGFDAHPTLSETIKHLPFLRSAGYLKDHSLAQQTFHPVSSSFGERQLELVEFRLPLADSEAWSPEMFANRAITELACALSAWQPARWSVLVPVNFERVPARPWKPSVDSLDSFPRTKYS